MSFKVGVITETLALSINDGCLDEDKNAFVSADGSEYYAKESYLEKLDPSQYTVSFISQAEVDGTLPVVKRLRVYP